MSDANDELVRLGKQAMRLGLRKNREAAQAKKLEDRRKLLVGAAVLSAVSRGDLPLLERLAVLCNGFYDRPREREVLGLPAEPGSFGRSGEWPPGFFAELAARADAARPERGERRDPDRGAATSNSATTRSESPRAATVTAPTDGGGVKSPTSGGTSRPS